MTKKGLRQQARKILKGARENPKLTEGLTPKEYREFWNGKRMGLCQLLGIDTCLRFMEFPFPWEEPK